MKDKLRELAAECRKPYPEGSHGTRYADGYNDAGNDIADRLESILDAEGDGGAVDSNALSEVIADMRGRERVGVEKYGVTVDRKDLKQAEWGKHLSEELMDALLYLKRLQDCTCPSGDGSLRWPCPVHPARSGMVSDEDVFYVDCEFDGHNGPLLSMALVAQDGRGLHITTDEVAHDPWVIANVLPLLDQHNATNQTKTTANGVGEVIRAFIGACESPEIVADSPVDIARFCTALSTNASGQWASADYPRMTFRVENVDCYPTTLVGAVQHNAWWDAMALRSAIQGERHER